MDSATIKADLKKLSLTLGDVLLVIGKGSEVHEYAQQIADTGMLPQGAPILVLDPDINVETLRGASVEVKDAIRAAMDERPPSILPDGVFDGEVEAINTE